MILLESLAEQFGHLGLFLASLISSTIIPFSVESLLLLAVGLGMRTAEAVGIVTLASTMGGFTTYLIGLSGGKLFGKKIDLARLDKYENLVEGGGAPVIFLAAFTPLPYELFSLPAGFLKMNPYTFLISTALGRALRFLMIGIYGMRVIEIFRAGEWGLLIVLIMIGVIIILLSYSLRGNIWSKIANRSGFTPSKYRGFFAF